MQLPRLATLFVLLAYDEVTLDYATPPTREEFAARLHSSDQYVAQHAQRMLEHLQQHGRLTAHYLFPAQLVRFDNQLTLVGLAGETCVDYSLRLKKELAGSALWVAGYCNDVMAYIPSARVLREGGYESGGSMIYSEIHPDPWAPGLEEKIIATVHALDRRLQARDSTANGRQ